MVLCRNKSLRESVIVDEFFVGQEIVVTDRKRVLVAGSANRTVISVWDSEADCGIKQPGLAHKTDPGMQSASSRKLTRHFLQSLEGANLQSSNSFMGLF